MRMDIEECDTGVKEQHEANAVLEAELVRSRSNCLIQKLLALCFLMGLGFPGVNRSASSNCLRKQRPTFSSLQTSSKRYLPAKVKTSVQLLPSWRS